MGRPDRFPSAGSFRRYSGLTPKASETGNSDAKGQVMSKAGASWLRDQLVMSANVARRVDPELARIYYVQMVERGAHHNKAVCIVASHLAGRAWTTMRRGQPYVLRDIDGTEVSAARGQGHRGRALHGARRGAPTQTDEEDKGEGPSSARGTSEVSLTRRRQARRPSPRSSFIVGPEAVKGDSRQRLTTDCCIESHTCTGSAERPRRPLRDALQATPEGAGKGKRRFQAGPRGPANSIVSTDIAPSRQGPAPDMSSASASPTLTALAPQGSDRDVMSLAKP